MFKSAELPANDALYLFTLRSALHAKFFNVVADFSPVRAMVDRLRLETFSIVPRFN
jgi:hypothetical protein